MHTRPVVLAVKVSRNELSSLKSVARSLIRRVALDAPAVQETLLALFFNDQFHTVLSFRREWGKPLLEAVSSFPQPSGASFPANVHSAVHDYATPATLACLHRLVYTPWPAPNISLRLVKTHAP